MKTATQTQPEVIRPVCDHGTAIRRLTGDISGRYGLFIETIWNSHEHGNASHIWITIEGRGASYEVIIVDDGKGMDAARRSRSLCMAQTAKEVVGRNYQDLGLKRLAADFKHVKVLTISAEEKAADKDDYPMCVMEYDFDWLFAVLADNSDKTVQVKHEKPNYRAMELPEGATGTKIHLTKVRDGRPHFTAEKLRKELTNHLPPVVAEKVYINGQPLEQRQIVGEPFRMVENHPKLGRIEIDVYIPKVKATNDRLMIGPYESVCDWQSFVRDIPDEAAPERLHIMTDGIFGEIHVEAFQRYVTASRQGFEVQLFSTDLIQAFVDFMELEVCSKLEEALGVIKEQQHQERDQRLLAELVRYTSVLGGDQEKVIRLRSVLKLDTSFIEVLPNQQPVVINVEQYDPELTIAWEVQKCGGKAEVSKDKRSLQYHSGKEVGLYRLRCYYKENTDIGAEVEISIVSEKLPRISPTRMTVHPGRTRTLLAVNWQDHSSGAENLRWRLDQEDKDGRFVVGVGGKRTEKEIGYGTEVVYRAGYQLGTYRVELFDTKIRGRVLAVTDITVANPPEPKKKGGSGPGDSDIVIDGATYQVGFEGMKSHPAMSRLYIGTGGKKQIVINRSHPACVHAEKRRGEEGLLELALSQIFLQHIDEQSRMSGEQLTAQEKTRRFSDLYASVAERYEDADK